MSRLDFPKLVTMTVKWAKNTKPDIISGLNFECESQELKKDAGTIYVFWYALIPFRSPPSLYISKKFLFLQLETEFAP